MNTRFENSVRFLGFFLNFFFHDLRIYVITIELPRLFIKFFWVLEKYDYMTTLSMTSENRKPRTEDWKNCESLKSNLAIKLGVIP